MKKIFRGFTLVELIVVIAILAILAITSFVVLSQWFVKSRNIRRVADLQWLKTALNSYYYSNFKYPMPGEAIEIRDENDEVIWYQWLFDDSVWGQMREVTKVPQDPLDKEYYGYSILVKNGEWYELVAFLEVVDTNLLWGVDKAYAISLSSRVPYVIGEYQEKWDFHLKPLTFIHPDYGVITNQILWSGWYVKIDTNTLTWYESSGWVVWGVNVEWWELWVADVIEIWWTNAGSINQDDISQALPVVGGVNSSVSTVVDAYMWKLSGGNHYYEPQKLIVSSNNVYIAWSRGYSYPNSTGFLMKVVGGNKSIEWVKEFWPFSSIVWFEKIWNSFVIADMYGNIIKISEDWNLENRKKIGLSDTHRSDNNSLIANNMRFSSMIKDSDSLVIIWSYTDTVEDSTPFGNDDGIAIKLSDGLDFLTGMHFGESGSYYRGVDVGVLDSNNYVFWFSKSYSNGGILVWNKSLSSMYLFTGKLLKKVGSTSSVRLTSLKGGLGRLYLSISNVSERIISFDTTLNFDQSVILKVSGDVLDQVWIDFISGSSIYIKGIEWINGPCYARFWKLNSSLSDWYIKVVGWETNLPPFPIVKDIFKKGSYIYGINNTIYPFMFNIPDDVSFSTSNIDGPYLDVSPWWDFYFVNIPNFQMGSISSGIISDYSGSIINIDNNDDFYWVPVFSGSAYGYCAV